MKEVSEVMKIRQVLCRFFIIYPFMVAIMYKVRKQMGEMSDVFLSKFLVETIFVEGTRYLLISIFFMFEPIRCALENDDDFIILCRTVSTSQ